MEHLVKNTYNEKLILSIQRIGQNTENEIKTEIGNLANKLIGVCIAIFSSITSGIIVNTISGENIPRYLLVAIFIICVFLLFFFSSKVFKKIIYFLDDEVVHGEERIELFKVFNTEIIQKITEINESISIANSTGLIECKYLNLVISLYNLNDVLNFIEEKIYDPKCRIRKLDDGKKVFNKYINIYALAAVSIILSDAKDKLNILMNDNKIKNIKGYDILYEDCNFVIKRIKKFEEYINRLE